MTALTSSLKATRRRETEDDPIAGLKRAQADYKAAKTGFRIRQRQILQDVYRSVSDLIDDDEACHKFMKRGPVAKFAGHDGDPATDADRGDVWFHALAFVYQAKSRESRKRASKHASALRLLYAEDVDADQIAATIKKRGGIQKLANEAAKPNRKGAKKRAEKDDAEAEAGNGEENDDAVADVAADADEEVRFSISEQLTDKVRSCRGKRIKIIAPPAMLVQIGSSRSCQWAMVALG